MQQFITHTGEIVEGERLKVALKAVGNWYIKNAHAIRKENAYAAHVTEETKIKCLQRQLELGERIVTGREPCGFWLWQRINTELTGKCVGFLPEPPK